MSNIQCPAFGSYWALEVWKRNNNLNGAIFADYTIKKVTFVTKVKVRWLFNEKNISNNWIA